MAKQYGTGITIPNGAKSSDGGGERNGRKVNGVAIGKQDGSKRAAGGKETGEFNTGRSESVCYTRTKEDYTK